MHRFPMPGGNGLGMAFGIAGFVGTLVFLALIVVLVMYLIKRNKQGQPVGPGPRSPLPPAVQILDDRLARGDIDIEDYLHRKAALMGDVPKPTEWTPTPPEGAAPNGEQG